MKTWKKFVKVGSTQNICELLRYQRLLDGDEKCLAASLTLSLFTRLVAERLELPYEIKLP